jgi:hypothetical protein
MAYGETKVYVIGPTPEVEAEPAGLQAPASDPSAPSAAPNAAQASGTDDPIVPVQSTEAIAAARAARRSREAGGRGVDVRSWWSLLAPTVLGPIAAAFRSAGRARIAWAIAGGLPILGAIALLVFGPAIRSWVGMTPWGALAWLLLVGIGTIHTAFAWALGSHAATADNRRDAGPSWRDEPGHVGVFGFLFPGLGLRLAGCRRLAAAALGATILGVGAAVFVANTPWLWLRLRSGSPAGISGTAFEILLIGAVAVLAACSLVWIVQGLDGARRVARVRSPLLTDAVSAALLVAIAVFGLAFRPAGVAANLHTVASALDAQGFRVIPLALCETSARLDRASPVYLADAADLLDSLGQHEEAHLHRREIERRMTEYLQVLGHREGFVQVMFVPGGGEKHPARTGNGTAYQRAAVLFE